MDNPPAGPRVEERLTPHALVGHANLRRVGWWGFPIYELVQDGEPVAHMGRAGWFRIFLGRGQRIELPDSSRWRLRAITAGGDIWPVVLDGLGRKVAIGGVAHGAYGINTRDAAFMLYREGRSRRARRRWVLRHFETEVATISSEPAINAIQPVPLGVVLVSFVIVRYGLPSDASPKLPGFSWA